MAGLGKNTFVAGNTLTAAQVNGYLMDQAVMRFASASARDTAIPSPTEGMVCYLDDVNWLMLYTGSAWTITGGDKPYFIGSSSGSIGSGTWYFGGNVASQNRGGFTSSSSIFVPKTGLYSLTVSGNFGASAAGARAIRIWGPVLGELAATVVGGTANAQLNVSNNYYYNAGDAIQPQIYQSSGAAMSVVITAQMVYLGS